MAIAAAVRVHHVSPRGVVIISRTSLNVIKLFGLTILPQAKNLFCHLVIFFLSDVPNIIAGYKIQLLTIVNRIWTHLGILGLGCRDKSY